MNRRLALFIGWFISYALCLIILISFLFLHYAEPPNLPSYLGDISTIYVPFLTPMFAFWFPEASNREKLSTILQFNKTNAESERESGAYLVAVALSLVFNLILIVLLASIYFRSGEATIELTIKIMRVWAGGFGVFVGLAIGYFFNSAASRSRRPAAPKSGKSKPEKTGGPKASYGSVSTNGT
jgi:hypothetical protein